MKKRATLSHAVRVLQMRDMFINEPYVTIPSLREKFGVCRKTVYNDLAALEEGGVPIFPEKVDGETRWKLNREAKSKTVTMTLNETQVLALGLAQQALSFLGGTFLHDAFREITEMLEGGVKPETKNLLKEVPRKLAIVPYGPKLYADKEDVLDDLFTGMLKNERVKISYQAPGGRRKQHVIEPLTLVLYRESLYLIANIQKSGKRACFAVERISESTWLRKEKFDYPSDHDSKAYFDGAFGLTCGEAQSVEILFDQQQARYVQERHWHPTQKFEELEDGRVRMTMEASGMGDVLRWLIGQTGSFEVVSPPALREEMLTLLRTGLDVHRAKPKEARKSTKRA